MSTKISASTVTGGITTSFWELNHRNFKLGLNLKQPRRRRCIANVVAYFEKPEGPLKEMAGRIIGSLPVVGLLYRILNDEGGVGGDRVRFPEFCRRVERRCPLEASQAFVEFKERHGKRGNPRFVLFWCWVAAVGAGLLKSDDIMMGASRLRASYDLPYEEERFNLLMDEASAKRAKSKSQILKLPLEDRIEKALDAISKCCIGKDVLEKEDAQLICTMLCAIFPSVDRLEIENRVGMRVKQELAFSDSREKEKDEHPKEKAVQDFDSEPSYE
eukprot:TRINITY_DN2694_c0_g1_i1.p1 TRINITY_DN2694_c0_g1~~TRINITY_DN2694_c0_g1_i1.p1  ORF type:complete len:273 (+),score=48.90 TRINITY_DN2694_c0_g1_i1:166-984(+)